MEQVYVGMDLTAVQIQYLMNMNQRLQMELQAERKRRKSEEGSAKSKARIVPGEWSEFKRDGHRKATKAQSLGSYDEIKRISDWFMDQRQYRNWALWRCGIAFGLRFSDLVSLKWKQLVHEDCSFRDYVNPIERKTQKRHTCLITDVVKETLAEYVRLTNNRMAPDDFVFPGSTKGKGDGSTPLTTSQGCKILKAAADACGIETHVSTHTMRKTMVNIACCIGGVTLDSGKFALARGLLNHSSEATSMAYLDRIDPMLDDARRVVSDFILGKTEEKEIRWDSGADIASISDRLAGLERILTERMDAIDCQ